MISVPPERGGYQQNPLNEVSWLSKFGVSSFSMTGYRDIQTGHFAKFDQFKINSHFSDIGQVPIDPYLFSSTLGRSQVFY